MQTNITTKETELIEQIDIRDKYIERVEVLDKVKELFLIPEIEVVTMNMMADYFEVGISAIKSCYQRNKSEIDDDGVAHKRLTDMKDSRWSQDATSVKYKTKTTFIINGFELDVPNAGIKVFSKRSVLRIAMLLRDSKIAKEIRTQLLNIFEHSTDTKKTAEINNENELLMGIARSYVARDFDAFVTANKNYLDYQNRHIAKIENTNAKLLKDNRILAGEILEWTDRQSLNKAVRILSGKSQQHYSTIFRDLYDELRYKHGICLSNRGKAPFIQYIKEHEWKKVIQSFSAICQNFNLSPSEILKRAKF